MSIELEHALGGIADIPQFFIWRLQWNAATAKFDKTPCAHDGSVYRVDASQPQAWCDYDAAQRALAALAPLQTNELRYALGFWLTADCGYFLLDLDHCTDDHGQVQPFAAQLVNCYPGAMVEWSSSGKGLHVIGMGEAPAHRNKPAADIAARLAPLQLELYTRDRGIAFGLTGQATGCANARFDLGPLVATYFPPRAAIEPTEPRGGFPGTDDELIARALNARDSAAVALGGAASFADQWHGRVEKDSNADMSLASRLAFWCGVDPERVERIMRRSGLRRDKWDERRPGGTYLSTTIQHACEQCQSTYTPPEPLPSPLPVQNTRKPTVQNAADLQQRTFQPIQWALQDILPEGVTILSSDPKLGKSWMVYTWCIAIASGKAIWDDRAPERQGDALLLALEDNDRRMRRRLDKLLPTFGNPDISRLFYSCDWPRSADGVAAIREFLIAHPETRIVVIDTIAAFRNADPGRKNMYSWDYEVGALLKPLSQEFQCAFVLVSHNRKPGSGDTHVNHEVSGSTGLTGGVDNVFVLKRSSGHVTAVLHTDGRDVEHPLELALQLHDGKWQFVGNAKDVNRSQQRNSVLEALARIGGAGTARDIHDAMGATEKLGTLRVRLTRMVSGGELDLNGRIYTRADIADKFPALITPQPPTVIPGVIFSGITPPQEGVINGVTPLAQLTAPLTPPTR